MSRSTDAADGTISMGTSAQVDSRTNADRTNFPSPSNATGGGKIIFAGGSADPVTTTTGYAQIGTAAAGGFTGVNFSNGAKVYSGGGDITVRGRVTGALNAASNYQGVRSNGNLIMDAGTNGAISISGDSTATQGGALVGIELGGNDLIKTTDGDITLYGTVASGGQFGYGISFYGATAEAVGTGKVSASAYSGGGTGNFGGMRIESNSSVLAKSGDITLTDTTLTGGAAFLVMTLGSSTLGSKGGSDVPSSTSNITIQANTLRAWGSADVPVNTSGTLSVLSNGTSFTQGFTISGLQLASTVSGLTIGKTTNTADLTLASTASVDINGPISIYGGNIALNGNLISSASAAPVLIKARGNITQGNSTKVQTNGGNIIFQSRSTDAANGNISMGTSAQVDSRTNADRTSGSTSNATGGGKIIFAGGSADPVTTTTGFAQNTNGTGINFSKGAKVYSGGGDITVRGRVTGASSVVTFAGVSTNGDLIMDAGTNGAISISGDSTAVQGSSKFIGIYLNKNTGGTDLIKTTDGDITLNGTVATGGRFDYGISTIGATVEAVGTGKVNLTGYSAGGSNDFGGIFLNTSSILATSGDITVTDTSATIGSVRNVMSLSSSTFGAGGSDVPSSTSNITLQGNTLLASGSADVAINISGNLSILSNGTSFTQALTYSGLQLASTVSGVTIGKTSNTFSLNLANPIAIAGPITIYGGNVDLNGNLISSASAAPVLIKAVGNITQGNNTKVQTNGGNIIFQSRSTDGADGNISMGTSAQVDSRTNADRTNFPSPSNATGGGKIIFAGGSADPVTTTTGYAQFANAAAGVGNGVNFSDGAKVYSGGGDITVRGRVTGSLTTTNNYAGVRTNGNLNMDAGTNGAISISGDSTAIQGSSSLVGIYLNKGAGGTDLIKTTDGDITLNGTVALGANYGYGTYLIGATVEAVGTGKVNVTGYSAGGAANYGGVRIDTSSFLARSGDITLTDTSATSATGAYVMSLGSSTFGSGGSDVPSSSSNITLLGNTVKAFGSADLAINTSGTLSILSIGTSFTQSFTISGLQPASSVSGLTIGKTSNTADLNFVNPIAIAGPISMYGGNVTLSGNLGSTSGDILTRATGTLTLAAAETVTTSNGNIDLTAARFVNNNTSATALAAGGSGKAWRVWSSNASPFTGGTSDVPRNLAFDYKQYGATYGTTTPAQTNNGLLYTLTASLSPTVSGSTTKTYDGLLSATAGTITVSNNIQNGGDTYVVSSYAYPSKDVGSNQPISLTVPAVAITNNNKPVYGYSLSVTNTATGSITAKPLNLQGSKTYDGSTSVAAASLGLSGLIGSETLSLSGSGSTADKNVGIGKTFTLGSLALGNGSNGGLASNYTLAGGTDTVTVTAANLTVTAPSVSKTYDATTTATGTANVGTLAGAGDAVNTAAVLAYTDKNVGLGNKTVRASGLTIQDGSNADVTGNYLITYVDNTASTITARPVNLSGSKVYDGTASFAAGSLGISGTAGGETLGLSGTGTAADKNAAVGKLLDTSALALGNGSGLASNYTLAGGTAVVDITQASLTVTAPAVTKTYDGTTFAAGSATVAALAGAGAGDVVNTAATIAYTDKNAGSGNKTVRATGLTIKDASNADVTGNYRITDQASTTADITPAMLRVVAKSASKTVDGVAYTGGNGVLYEGFVAGEDSSTLEGTLAYGGSSQGATNAGSYTISPGNVSSANYAVVFVDGVLTIAPATRPVPAPTPNPVPTPPSDPTLPTAGNGNSGGNGGDSGTQMGDGRAVGGPGTGVEIGTGTGTGEAGTGRDESVKDVSRQNAGCDRNVSAVCVDLQRSAREREIGLLNVSVPLAEAGAYNFNFELPQEIIGLMKGKQAVLTQIDGTELPKWLRFDSQSHSIVVTDGPSNAFPQQFSLKVGSLNYVMVISARQ